MFFRSQRLQKWARLNNLKFTKNNKKDILEYWADKNIIEGNYKGKNIYIYDSIHIDQSGAYFDGIPFSETNIRVNGSVIYPYISKYSFVFWNNYLSVKQITRILDAYIINSNTKFVNYYQTIRNTILFLIVSIFILYLIFSINL